MNFLMHLVPMWTTQQVAVAIAHPEIEGRRIYVATNHRKVFAWLGLRVILSEKWESHL